MFVCLQINQLLCRKSLQKKKDVMKDGAKVGSAVGWRGKGRQKDGAM